MELTEESQSALTRTEKPFETNIESMSCSREIKDLLGFVRGLVATQEIWHGLSAPRSTADSSVSVSFSIPTRLAVEVFCCLKTLSNGLVRRGVICLVPLRLEDTVLSAEGTLPLSLALELSLPRELCMALIASRPRGCALTRYPHNKLFQ